MSATGDAAAYELAYETGLRTIEEHATVLRETRDRAGALTSTAAVAAGLVAGLASQSGSSVGGPEIIGGAVGAVGFLGVVATTLLIWKPMDVWLVQDPSVIVGSYVDGDPPMALPEVHRELALWMGKQARSNSRALDLRLKTFNIGLVFLVVQLLGSVIALGGAASG